MDACKTILVQSEVAPSDIVRWLHAWAEGLPPPRCEASWILGPRDYGQKAGAPLVYEPAPYETLALYAMPAGDPFSPGEIAFSITISPLRQRCVCLELRRWPPLPVALETVVDHMGSYFSGMSITVSSAAPLRTKRGAPPLVCNVWLERQLEAYSPHTSLRPLYMHWLEQYRAVRGNYPAAPARSFRAAVAGCRQRMQARR